jgi:hypothetical protein
MRLTGSSVPCGFHASLGAIGSVATAAASSAMCTNARALGRRSVFSRKCAYA